MQFKVSIQFEAWTSQHGSRFDSLCLIIQHRTTIRKITILIGGLVPVPSHGWFHCYTHIILKSCCCGSFRKKGLAGLPLVIIIHFFMECSMKPTIWGWYPHFRKHPSHLIIRSPVFSGSCADTGRPEVFRRLASDHCFITYHCLIACSYIMLYLLKEKKIKW